MRILRALVLVSALSVCAYAGDMDNGITAPPPSAPATAGSTTEPTAGEAADAQSTENVTLATLEVILSVMQGVLTVF
jgi:hypothetical protein